MSIRYIDYHDTKLNAAHDVAKGLHEAVWDEEHELDRLCTFVDKDTRVIRVPKLNWYGIVMYHSRTWQGLLFNYTYTKTFTPMAEQHIVWGYENFVRDQLIMTLYRIQDLR